jgi:hypothetical protein
VIKVPHAEIKRSHTQLDSRITFSTSYLNRLSFPREIKAGKIFTYLTN